MTATPAPEYVQSRDGLIWRVTQKHYVRASRTPYLLDVTGLESGLPNAFAPDEVTPVADARAAGYDVTCGHDAPADETLGAYDA